MASVDSIISLYMFLHCINLDYPNLTCQLRPWFEVIDFYTIRMPICDLLFVIITYALSCTFSKIQRRDRSQKPPHLSVSPKSRRPL